MTTIMFLPSSSSIFFNALNSFIFSNTTHELMLTNTYAQKWSYSKSKFKINLPIYLLHHAQIYDYFFLATMAFETKKKRILLTQIRCTEIGMRRVLPNSFIGSWRENWARKWASQITFSPNKIKKTICEGTQTVQLCGSV